MNPTVPSTTNQLAPYHFLWVQPKEPRPLSWSRLCICAGKYVLSNQFSPPTALFKTSFVAANQPHFTVSSTACELRLQWYCGGCGAIDFAERPPILCKSPHGPYRLCSTSGVGTFRDLIHCSNSGDRLPSILTSSITSCSRLFTVAGTLEPYGIS